MRHILSLALFLALPSVLPAQVLNGSFEPDSPMASYLALPGGSTAIPGWTTTDTGVEWFDPLAYGPTPAPSGSYVVDIANTIYTAGGIEQTFATTPGTTYVIDFHLGTQRSDGRDGTCQILVSADATLEVFDYVNLSSTATFGLRSFAFTAADHEATLAFRCIQSANYHFAFIDGIGAEEVVGNATSEWGAVKRLYR